MRKVLQHLWYNQRLPHDPDLILVNRGASFMQSVHIHSHLLSIFIKNSQKRHVNTHKYLLIYLHFKFLNRALRTQHYRHYSSINSQKVSQFQLITWLTSNEEFDLLHYTDLISDHKFYFPERCISHVTE